jgi:hypothetical protein
MLFEPALAGPPGRAMAPDLGALLDPVRQDAAGGSDLIRYRRCTS